MPETVICDLDGVVYRGDQAVPGSADALQRLAAAGLRTIFATNNSSRTALKVVEKLLDVVGYRADVDDIVTSAQAVVSLIPFSIERCFVVGGSGIVAVVRDSGRTVVDTAADAECVIVGIDFDINYQTLAEASTAIRAGAMFIASNTDATYPSPTGLLPGAGSIVAAIATASGVEPVKAGKPEKPFRDVIRSLGVSEAWVIGDRIDTDIRMAAEEPDWSSIVVMTGVTGPDEDLSTADHVVDDLRSAVDLVIAHQDRQ